ncbi:LuxR C-terminal-related transcriptional regulator [Streptomyces sp. NPDC050400]|uniref:helix-turn-helix transcriptional regulator n=1 Tax=Streptomyces sp. NPDC050400 TaxID=3365610 RepID=UPI0037B874BB
MTTVLCARGDADLARGVRVSALRGRLHALARDPAAPDAAVTTCLVWVAGVLVEIAGDVADPRSAGALVHEASAVLASVPAVPHDGTARGAPPPHEPLTGRQLAVLRQLQEEVPLRQIADGMYVSYNTVKSHARAVYRKLGARSRAEAVDRARELGLV